MDFGFFEEIWSYKNISYIHKTIATRKGFNLLNPLIWNNDHDQIVKFLICRNIITLKQLVNIGFLDRYYGLLFCILKNYDIDNVTFLSRLFQMTPNSDSKKELQINLIKFILDNDLTDTKNQFKVKVNAKQYNLSGVAIMYSSMNIIIVEGGPKGIRQYKKLLLNRMDWENNREESTNSCKLLWEGQISNRMFQGFYLKPFSTEASAKEYIESVGGEQYWKLAKNSSSM